MILEEKRCWVRLTYPDGSEFCFETTLNPDILRDLNIVLEPLCLPRLDKQYYIGGEFVYKQIPASEARITVIEKKFYTHKPSEQLHDFL